MGIDCVLCSAVARTNPCGSSTWRSTLAPSSAELTVNLRCVSARDFSECSGDCASFWIVAANTD